MRDLKGELNYMEKRGCRNFFEGLIKTFIHGISSLLIIIENRYTTKSVCWCVFEEKVTQCCLMANMKGSSIWGKHHTSLG